MLSKLSLILKEAKLPDFDILWLRDNCRCGVCWDYKTSERRIMLTNIPKDLDVASCEIESEKLSVVWSDGHESSYGLDFLTKYQYQPNIKPKTELVLWDKKTFESEVYQTSRLPMNELMSSYDGVKRALKMLATYGVVFIDGVLPTVKNTEFVTRQLFPIQKTFFGEMWTISNFNRKHKDSAYADSYLGPHTDNPYWNAPSGGQVIHCILHDGEGAESLLIDGFHAVEKIRYKHPDAFQRLCNVPVVFEYIEEGRHHKYTGPLINLDPITKRVQIIRYNNNDRSPDVTLDKKDDVRQFNEDLRIFMNEMESLENRSIFKLRPGTVMVFDNWRLVHGRYAFNGKRMIAGAYISRDDYDSELRVNGFIQ